MKLLLIQNFFDLKTTFFFGFDSNFGILPKILEEQGPFVIITKFFFLTNKKIFFLVRQLNSKKKKFLTPTLLFGLL